MVLSGQTPLQGAEPSTTTEIMIGHSKLQANLSGKDILPRQPELLAYIGAAAKAVSGYYGAFPTPQLQIFVKPMTKNNERIFGWVMRGEEVHLEVGSQVSLETIKNN